MKPQEIVSELESIPTDEEFESGSNELAETLISRGVGLEAVKPILLFMESHPQIDYGAPGPLVHFMERHYKSDEEYRNTYEELVVESIRRKPTAHTVFLLNRLMNGAKVPEKKQRFMAKMAEARTSPSADQPTIEAIDGFLEFQAERT
jgi:hypothetical protein